MRKINVAKNAGFCFGVKRAVNIALEEAEKGQNVSMLGDIVHNEYVVKKISDAGVKVKNNIDSISDGVLLLRAHGTVPEIYEKAKGKGLQIVDATCPFVLDIHEHVKNLDKEGYQIIIIGDYGHDEVIGIASQVKNAIVIACPEDVPKKIPGMISRMGVIVQSTQNIENARRTIMELIPKCRELKYIDTICGPTKRYQREIKMIPKENDVMIVVGSFTSANTSRLTEISKELNPRTYQVESEADILSEWFEGARTVGITAGASTPDWIIEEVVDKIKKISE